MGSMGSSVIVEVVCYVVIAVHGPRLFAGPLRGEYSLREMIVAHADIRGSSILGLAVSIGVRERLLHEPGFGCATIGPERRY